jgi:hypothetical protein
MGDPVLVDDWLKEQMQDPEFSRAYRRYGRPWWRAWHWLTGWVTLLWEVFWEAAVDG